MDMPDGFIPLPPRVEPQAAFRPLLDDLRRTLARPPFERAVHSVYLYGSVARGEAITGRSDLDLTLVLRDPPSPELADLQPKLESKHKINKLRKLLDELDEDYDRIYLDTPPALNFYTVSALIAADRCLIPFDCDSFSRQALYGLLQEIEELRDDHNEDLQVEGIVVNQFQPRASLPQQLLDELVAEELPVLPVYLMSSVKMRESHQACTPLIFLEPRHKLTQQFVELHGLLES